MENENNKFYQRSYFLIPVIVALIMIGFGFGIIFLKTESENFSNIIANSISLITLIVTGVSIYFLYRTLDSQNIQLKSHQKQITSNKYDLEYNRVIDVVYRQMQLDLETYQRLKPIVNNLEVYYNNQNDLPKNINALTTLAINQFSMSWKIEQFISRTTLDPHDRSYLFLIYEEGFSIEIKNKLIKLQGQIEKMGKSNEEISKKLKSIYIKSFPPVLSITDVKNILKSQGLKNYLRNCQESINMILRTNHTRQRLMIPGSQNKKYEFI